MSSFLLEDRSISAIANAIKAEPEDWKWGEEKRSTPELGAALFALNVAAIRARYGEDDEQAKHEFQYVLGVRPRSRFALVKSLSCLLYQCSEGDIDEQPLFLRLENYRDRLALEIVRGLPAYELESWE